MFFDFLPTSIPRTKLDLLNAYGSPVIVIPGIFRLQSTLCTWWLDYF